MIPKVKLDIRFTVQFSTENITRHIKETKKYVPFKGKNKPAEIVSEKDLVAHLIDKGFKTLSYQSSKN